MTKEERLKAELQRTRNMQKFEEEYSMYTHICGVDEGGRGEV